MNGGLAKSKRMQMDQSTATHRIRLAAAALNQTPMAWDTNARHIRAALAGRRATRASAFSACRSCASPATAARTCSSRPACSRRRSSCCVELLPDTAGLVARWACPCFTKAPCTTRRPWPATASCLGIVCKQHLAGDGIHYEPRWFRRWPAGEVEHDRNRRPGISDRRLAVRLRRRADRPRNLPRRLGRRPHRLLARPARGRRAAQSQRQPFRVRQAADSRAVRARRLAGVLRELRLLPTCSATRRAGRSTTAAR